MVLIETLLDATWTILLELAPWLLLGTVVAALLHGFLPTRLVRTQLRGPGGVAKAVLVGVPMPLCSCGVIPAGLGLKKDGASDGAAIGFLISTPQTGVDSILVSASFLGWPFALFKVASAAVTGLAGGWITDRFAPQPEAESSAAVAAEEQKRGPREMWEHGIDLLRSIWLWLVLGVLVSAALTVFLPENGLASVAAWGPLGAALAALAVSLPLYVCATASVPIAAALVQSGMPAGAALVFLMAGPATNVATIGAILRSFGRRTAAIYLGTVIVGSVGLGILFDSVLETEATQALAAHEHITWWAVASAVLLLTLLARFAFDDLWGLVSRRSTARAAGERHELAVAGMNCDNCANKLKRALQATQGVNAAEVSLDPGRAVVFGAVDDDRLREVVREAGFQPV